MPDVSTYIKRSYIDEATKKQMLMEHEASAGGGALTPITLTANPVASPYAAPMAGEIYYALGNGTTQAVQLPEGQLGMQAHFQTYDSSIRIVKDAGSMGLSVYAPMGVQSVQGDWVEMSGYAHLIFNNGVWFGYIMGQGSAADSGGGRLVTTMERPLTFDYPPAQIGDLTVNATNTSLLFRFKGSDGVIRSGTITLA